MASWLSWLERRPVTAEVAGSSPAGVVSDGSCFWDHSSAGRAPALQAGGHRFEPCWSHFSKYADMAQLAEQLICNQQVNGSSPFIGFYGWIPEWPKGADCKSVGTAFEGSNPSPSIKINNAGWSSLEARRAHNPKVVGSNPAPATNAKACMPR